MARLCGCVVAVCAVAALGGTTLAQSLTPAERIDRDRFQKIFEKLELEALEKLRSQSGGNGPADFSKDDGPTAQSPGLCQVNPHLPQCGVVVRH